MTSNYPKYSFRILSKKDDEADWTDDRTGASIEFVLSAEDYLEEHKSMDPTLEKLLRKMISMTKKGDLSLYKFLKIPKPKKSRKKPQR
jgi:hypothetical protein